MRLGGQCRRRRLTLPGRSPAGRLQHSHHLGTPGARKGSGSHLALDASTGEALMSAGVYACAWAGCNREIGTSRGPNRRAPSAVRRAPARTVHGPRHGLRSRHPACGPGGPARRPGGAVPTVPAPAVPSGSEPARRALRWPLPTGARNRRAPGHEVALPAFAWVLTKPLRRSLVFVSCCTWPASAAASAADDAARAASGSRRLTVACSSAT